MKRLFLAAAVFAVTAVMAQARQDDNRPEATGKGQVCGMTVEEQIRYYNSILALDITVPDISRAEAKSARLSGSLIQLKTLTDRRIISSRSRLRIQSGRRRWRGCRNRVQLQGSRNKGQYRIGYDDIDWDCDSSPFLVYLQVRSVSVSLVGITQLKSLHPDAHICFPER